MIVAVKELNFYYTFLPLSTRTVETPCTCKTSGKKKTFSPLRVSLSLIVSKVPMSKGEGLNHLKQQKQQVTLTSSLTGKRESQVESGEREGTRRNGPGTTDTTREETRSHHHSLFFLFTTTHTCSSSLYSSVVLLTLPRPKREREKRHHLFTCNYLHILYTFLPLCVYCVLQYTSLLLSFLFSVHRLTAINNLWIIIESQTDQRFKSRRHQLQLTVVIVVCVSVVSMIIAEGRNE